MRNRADIEKLHDRIAEIVTAPLFGAIGLEQQIRSDLLTTAVLLCWVLDHQGGDRPMRRFERIVEEVERQLAEVQRQVGEVSKLAGDETGHFELGQAELDVAALLGPFPTFARLRFDTEEFVRRDHLLKAQTHAGNVGNPDLN